MGRIFKKKQSPYWYYDIIDPDGKRKRESTGVRNKRDAELILSKIEVEIAEGKYFSRRNKSSKCKSFEEMAEEYLNWSRANKRSWDRDKRTLKILKNYFVNKTLAQISPFLIEGYKIKRSKEVSKRTVNLELACLKHLFTKAIEWGFAQENPGRTVKLFRVNNARVRYLIEDEIKRLLVACDDHLKPIIFTALQTGMRKGEILNMKWQDVDFENEIIHVPDSKSGERRDVPISAGFSKIIRKLKKKAVSDYVFTKLKGDGSPLKDIRTIFYKALKKAGIKDFRFHDLRHTFASHLMMNRVDLKTVQELLGHKDFSMTLRYSHLSPAHKKEAVNVMDRIVKESEWHTFGTPTKILKFQK